MECREFLFEFRGAFNTRQHFSRVIAMECQRPQHLAFTGGEELGSPGLWIILGRFLVKAAWFSFLRMKRSRWRKESNSFIISASNFKRRQNDQNFLTPQGCANKGDVFSETDFPYNSKTPSSGLKSSRAQNLNSSSARKLFKSWAVIKVLLKVRDRPALRMAVLPTASHKAAKGKKWTAHLVASTLDTECTPIRIQTHAE